MLRNFSVSTPFQLGRSIRSIARAVFGEKFLGTAAGRCVFGNTPDSQVGHRNSCFTHFQEYSGAPPTRSTLANVDLSGWPRLR